MKTPSSTSSDTVLDAVRAARSQISREFGNDPRRLLAYYLEYQKRFEARLVHGSDGESRSAAQPAVAADGATRRR